MLQPFSLTQSRCATVDAALREEIRARTGSAEAASGILRSIERFGTDPTIVRYQITPKSSNRKYREETAVAWSVRAVRTEGPRQDQ